MKYIRKILSALIICLFCTTGIINTSLCETNLPFGEIGEYGNWIIPENMETYRDSISSDVNEFQQNFYENVKNPGFVPIETKIGLMFMKALSAVSDLLKISLIPFTIVFLFIMYAFWIGLNAYKMIRESTDYKTVFYEVIKQGIIIVIWVIILRSEESEKLFTAIVSPVVSIGTYISDFIFKSIAQMYNSELPNTCAAIHQYVNNNISGGLLIDQNAAADIMCLPGRISTFFYHAIANAFDWVKYGLRLGTPFTATIVGIVAIYLFIKCIFKYAFMTLGVVTDLFFTILMLPFTALAEAMPSIDEKNYAGQIFNGLLKVFSTKKLSEVLATFINATIYFISLSIVISICAILLTLVISTDGNNTFNVGSAMTTLIAGCLVLHLANKADEIAKDLGGKIDNSFGTKLQTDTKNMWNDLKGFSGKVTKAWSKGKLFK